MTTIVIDGLNEEDFRRSIENRLREGRPGAAVERLRGLLAPYVGPEKILPERFLTVEAADLELQGWHVLGDAIDKHDRPGRPVTALSIAFGWQGEEPSESDGDGRSKPHVETSYFTDDAFPFSQCGREDLLEGYSSYGCNWAGDAEATDTALSVEGIDDLHGALAALEAQLLASDEPDEDGIRAGSLGSCLLSTLLFQAVGERIGRDGLPRPICVMAGSNDVYPYFDAPVAGIPDDVRKASEAEVAEAEAGQAVPAPRYSSLLMTSIPHARKRAVLVLEESDDELASGIKDLLSIGHAEGQDGQGPSAMIPSSLAAEPVDACSSPLLVKKPDRKARDVGGLLSPPGQKEPGVNERAHSPQFTSALPMVDAPANHLAPSPPAEPKSRFSVRLRWRNILKLADISISAITRFRTAGRGDTSRRSTRKRRI